MTPVGTNTLTSIKRYMLPGLYDKLDGARIRVENTQTGLHTRQGMKVIHAQVCISQQELIGVDDPTMLAAMLSEQFDLAGRRLVELLRKENINRITAPHVTDFGHEAVVAVGDPWDPGDPDVFDEIDEEQWDEYEAWWTLINYVFGLDTTAVSAAGTANRDFYQAQILCYGFKDAT